MSRKRLNLISAVMSAVLLGVAGWILFGRPGSGQAGDRQPGAGATSAGATGKGESAATRTFERFLREGPGGKGAWLIERLSDMRTTYAAPHPRDEGKILLQACAECEEDETAPCAFPRDLATRLFYEAPADLFFAAYELAEVMPDRKADTDTWRLTYLPRARTASSGAETRRIVWVDTEVGEPIWIEDHSRDGQVIRSVRRLSDETGTWKPENFDEGAQQHCEVCCAASGTPAEQLARVTEEAGFPVPLPEWMPENYTLLRARVIERSVSDDEAGDGEDDIVPARLVSLLYGDGLGVISIGIAPRADMDQLERAFLAMGERSGTAGACNSSEVGEASEVTERGSVIRVRSDACRTVLRRDGIAVSGGPDANVSVTLLCRNELPAEAYLRLMASLALPE